MATDFKLKVGLDVSTSQEQIRRDLTKLQNNLPSLDLKMTLSASQLREQITKLGTPKIPLGVEVDETSLKQVLNKISKELKLDFTPKQGSGGSGAETLRVTTKKAADEAERLRKSFQQVGSTATTKIASMTESLRKFGVTGKEINEELDKLLTQFNGLSHLMNVDVWNEQETKEVQEFLQSFKQVTKAYKETKLSTGAEFFDEAQLNKVKRSLNQIRELVAEYPKILSDPKFKAWYDQLNNIDFKNLKLGKQQVEKLTGEMEEFGSQTRQADLAVKTLAQRFGMIAKNATIGNIVQTLLSEVKQLARDVVVNVNELDAAMVELKKVTNETGTAYSKFFENAKVQAADVGSSLTDAITATADYARLGYSISEAADLAKASQIYYNVGDGFNSITEASESVISTMKAFGIETKDVMSIVDAFNTTGNNFAISTQGVGEAMKRSASALAAAGNDMYESIALITAANSVVQDPASVGTALKTKFCLDVQKCAS